MRVILKNAFLAPDGVKHARSKNRQDIRNIPDKFRDRLPSTAINLDAPPEPKDAQPVDVPDDDVQDETLADHVPIEDAAAAAQARAEDLAQRETQAQTARGMLGRNK